MLYLFLLLALFFRVALGQHIEEVQLKQWTSKLGLASNGITGITQDPKGFLWVATEKGLNRFDGDAFLTINLPGLTANGGLIGLLSHGRFVYAITATAGCLQIDTDTLKSWPITLDQIKDKELQTALGQFVGQRSIGYNNSYFTLTKAGQLHINGNLIPGRFNDFYKDAKNRLWISSLDQGIGYWAAAEQKVKYLITPTDLASPYFNGLGQQGLIKEDKSGRVWFYRGLGSICFWDYETNKAYTIKDISAHPYLNGGYKLFSSLIDLEINSLFADQAGNLWVGTARNGLFRIRFKQQPFQFYEFDYSSKIGLADEDISIPAALSNGDIWIGTWGGGINILKKDDLKSTAPNFEVIQPQKGKKGALQDGQVFPVYEDSKHNIWVGTLNGGLHFLAKEDREANRYFFTPYNKENSAIASDVIMDVFEDHQGLIWVATQGGLSRFDSHNNQFQSSFPELKNPDFFKDMAILGVFLDTANILWVQTTYQGLIKWNRTNNQITQIKDIDGVSANSILKIAQDQEGALWFAGYNGLFHYHMANNSFDYRVSTAELSQVHLESIVIGQDQLIWLGTDKGLFTYNTATKVSEKIDLSVGVKNNNFTRGASKDANGYLHFGTRNGFYRLNPKDFTAKTAISTVFTDVKINGASYRNVLEQSFKGKDVSVGEALLLNHQQNTFSISYKKLNFYVEDIPFFETSMTKTGSADQWVPTYATSRSWTNLDPGHYTFKVRQNKQDKATVMAITISPPWWKSTAAMLVYGLLLLAGAYFLIRLLTQSAVAKEKKIQNEKFDQQRFKFFLNIAHEIRTPLTLIKGGVERLKEGEAVNKDYTKELDRVFRNTERLSRLVNEVLDLKKIERRQIQPNLKPLDLKWFLENIVDVFSYRENEIGIGLHLPEGPVSIISDKQLLESIVYNLLSNAIKYSGADAKIEVSLSAPADGQVNISIKDNGVGIKKEEQQLVFERLYQSDEHLKTGTGIGLSIVKQYVALLAGKINLQSHPSKGSTFTVSLPYTATQLAPKIEGVQKVTTSINTPKAQTLLVVDDQEELRAFVKEIFEKDYQVFEAGNGEEGLIMAKKHRPALVISDVMMPLMDGISMSKQIRADLSISHTPIILLTAKTGDQVEIAGLSSGADAYLSKPFNQALLKSKVEMLIKMRKELIKKYSLSTEENLTVLAASQTDKLFLEKFEGVLEQQYEYPDLSVEELASEMAVSVSGLYTKIKSITGSPPVEFVRIYRLKKAAHLLKTTKFSVTEISTKVGFGTQKYFSKSFKKHFGLTPLQYRKG